MIVKKIKKLELIKKRPGLSFNRATIFMLIFATIGGFIIWRSFAASSVGDLNGDGNVDMAADRIGRGVEIVGAQQEFTDAGGQIARCDQRG